MKKMMMDMPKMKIMGDSHSVVMKIMENTKDKWNTSQIVSRQGTGVFLGGHKMDMEMGNPFKSAKQRKYLFSQKPSVAKKFAKHSM